MNEAMVAWCLIGGYVAMVVVGAGIGKYLELRDARRVDADE